VTLLYIHALTVTDAAGRRLLDRLSLHVDAGQVLGLAGGPQVGKSLLCELLCGARPVGLEITHGRILLGNRDLAAEPSPNNSVIAFGGDGNQKGETLIAVYDCPTAVPAGRQPTDTGAIVIDRDPAALAGMCDEIAILCAGHLVERAPAADLIHSPRHPYTKALLDGGRQDGDLDFNAEGCPFQLACAHGESACNQANMLTQMISPEHATACVRWRDLWPVV
jgi:ABC-type dipeptide/oligopeptide/nickel transport system ATPase component